MLNHSFYNLTEPKRVVVHVEEQYRGICVTLSDSHGDELQVVLRPETARQMVDGLRQIGALDCRKCGAKLDKLEAGLLDKRTAKLIAKAG
jgi:hypothetical protein